MRRLERESFDELFAALKGRGYEVIGPTVRQQAISLEPISSAEEMPIGITEEQAGGTYRLHDRGDGALFGFSNGPQSWKRLLHPPVIELWRATRSEPGGKVEITEAAAAEARPRAFLGVRSCDLHAIRTLDRSLSEIDDPDPHYAERREGVFIVALNCSVAGGTCFCVSMGTGPEVQLEHDLVMTEVVEGGAHYFLLDAGSERGAEVLAGLPTEEAGPAGEAKREEIVAATAASMGRELETEGIKELLYRNFEHPRWDEVADRCLTCGNCTMVCPTCFCTDVETTGDLAGNVAETTRHWDSCFTTEFTYVHGGSIRPDNRSRYRQWMTHKLATWFDQFGTSGCVGCGRCITWCPVAIDITEEAAAIRATDGERAG